MMTMECQVLVALLVLSTIVTATSSSEKNSCTVGWFDGLKKRLRRTQPSTTQEKNGEFELELIHSNDMHSRFEQTNRMLAACSQLEAERQMCYGGFARISTVIKEAREKVRRGKSPPVLVLNAGDNFQGSIYYNLFKTEIVTKFMNKLGFDALTLGNHEYDDGPMGLEPYLRGITSPIVAANVDHSKCPLLNKFELRPSVVWDIGDQKVGVIGYLTQGTKELTNTCTVVISDEIAAVKKEAARLSDQGVKIIIALGHSGFTVDKQLAYEVPEVDLVIGGRSHTFLYNVTKTKLPDILDPPTGTYPTVITQRSGKKVPVVQAYAFTKYIGRLSLAFDADGEMTSITGNPLLLDKNVPEDPAVLEELNVWKKKVPQFTYNVVGSASILLANINCRHTECNLGNVIADAHVHYISKTPTTDENKDDPYAPIALINSGNIWASIDARTRNGEVTRRDIIEAVPSTDVIHYVKLKGDVLIEVLEHSVSQYDPTLSDNKGAFLQVSGLKVEYNIDEPSGQRVVKVSALCSKCDIPGYYRVENDRTYSVLVPSSIGQGGYGFTMIADKGKILALAETSQAAVVSYFNDMSPIKTDISGRIFVKYSAMP